MMHPTAQLLITGHSAGGATSVLAAAELARIGVAPTSVITFAAPRVGNLKFSQRWESEVGAKAIRSFRVINNADFVPQVPMVVQGFHHVGTEVWYSPKTGPSDPSKNVAVPWSHLAFRVCNGAEDPSCSARYMPKSGIWWFGDGKCKANPKTCIMHWITTLGVSAITYEHANYFAGDVDYTSKMHCDKTMASCGRGANPDGSFKECEGYKRPRFPDDCVAYPLPCKQSCVSMGAQADKCHLAGASALASDKGDDHGPISTAKSGGRRRLCAITPAPPTPGPGGHNKTHGWDVDVSVAVHFGGILDVGFAGIFKKQAPTGNVENFPHFVINATFDLAWDKDHMDKHIAPTFVLSKPKFCVGKFLSDVLTSLTSKIDHMINPVRPVVDFLTRDVPVTKLFLGKPLKVIELIKMIYDDFCEGDCVFDKMFEFVEAFLRIFKQIETFEDIAKSLEGDDSTCGGVRQALHDFKVDFKDSDPKPEPLSGGGGGGGGGIPWPPAGVDPSKIEFSNAGVDQHLVKESYLGLSDMHPGAKKWAIKFPMMDHLEEAIIDLILHKNFEIVTLEVPPAIAATHTSWSFPVWPWPEVALFVDFKAQVELNIGRISVLSNGVFDAIRNKDASQLLQAVGVPTVDDKGNKLWPLTGFVQIGAGASLGILIFEVGAMVAIRATGKVRIRDLDGSGWLTLSELLHLMKGGHGKAVEIGIDLDAIFELFIEACIPLLFTELCWNIVDWRYDLPLMREDILVGSIPSVGNGRGDTNVGLAADSAAHPNAVFTIMSNPNGHSKTDMRHDGMDQSFPGRVAVVPNPPKAAGIGTYGDSGGKPYTLKVVAVNRPFAPKIESDATLQFDVEACGKDTNLAVSRCLVLPSNALGGKVSCPSDQASTSSRWKEMQFVNPTVASTILATSLSSPTLFHVTSDANVTLAGLSGSDFTAATPVTLHFVPPSGTTMEKSSDAPPHPLRSLTSRGENYTVDEIHCIILISHCMLSCSNF